VPADAATVLLVHCDGAGGSTAFADSSPSPKTVTATGSAQVSTAQSRFGGGSAALDGTGDYLSVADHADWHFGAGPFTVECWARFTVASDADFCLIGQWGDTGSAADSSWVLWCAGGSLNFKSVTAGTGVYVDVQNAFAPATGQWYHIAADRDASNVLRIYVDGAVVSSGTNASTFADATSPLRVGSVSPAFAFYDFTGFLDEVRVSKGVARYGGAFTVPVAAFGNEVGSGGRAPRRQLGLGGGI
jgi:hypothetical protein